jgi:hypothetical protein
MPVVIRFPLLVLAVAAPFAVVGCGDSIDTGDIEQTVVEQFAAQGIPLKDTTCEDVDAEVGAPVRCTARNPQGSKLFLEGKVTAIEDGKGRFQVTATGGEAEGTAVAAEAKAVLERGVGKKADAMTCPETVVMPTKRPVRCTITVGGGTRYGVSVTIDGKGKMRALIDDEPMS